MISPCGVNVPIMNPLLKHEDNPVAHTTLIQWCISNDILIIFVLTIIYNTIRTYLNWHRHLNFLYRDYKKNPVSDFWPTLPKNSWPQIFGFSSFFPHLQISIFFGMDFVDAPVNLPSGQNKIGFLSAGDWYKNK